MAWCSGSQPSLCIIPQFHISFARLIISKLQALFIKKTRWKPRTRMFTCYFGIERSESKNCALVGISCLCCNGQNLSTALLYHVVLQNFATTLLYDTSPQHFSTTLFSTTLLHNTSLRACIDTLPKYCACHAKRENDLPFRDCMGSAEMTIPCETSSTFHTLKVRIASHACVPPNVERN